MMASRRTSLSIGGSVMRRFHQIFATCTAIVAILAGLARDYAAAAESPAFSVSVPSAEELVKRIKPRHPRLLVGADGFEGLKKKIAADPVLQKWDADLRGQADRCLKEKLPEHVMPDGLRLLSTSRNMLHHS